MDIDYLKSLDDEGVKAEIRRLSRSEMDEQFKLLGAQRALLSQKLEAVLSPEREALFASIRPGGLEEIDRAIELAKKDAAKELLLLHSYRDLNRILLYFMDAYEEHVLGDLKHMSKEELQLLYAKVCDQHKVSKEILNQTPNDYRKAQDASGNFRLAGLFKAAIQMQLRERFGYEPDEPSNS